jgi:hypothetical protein
MAAEAWKGHNIKKTTKMTEAAKIREEKKAQAEKAKQATASAVDPTSPEHLAWMASQKGAK